MDARAARPKPGHKFMKMSKSNCACLPAAAGSCPVVRCSPAHLFSPPTPFHMPETAPRRLSPLRRRQSALEEKRGNNKCALGRPAPEPIRDRLETLNMNLLATIGAGGADPSSLRPNAAKYWAADESHLTRAAPSDKPNESLGVPDADCSKGEAAASSSDGTRTMLKRRARTLRQDDPHTSRGGHCYDPCRRGNSASNDAQKRRAVKSESVKA